MIQTKRNSLEKFIREQMEGPGACREQFYYMYNDSYSESSKKEEIINTTPGSLYSTAVLFPRREQKEGAIEASKFIQNKKNTELELQEENSEYQESQDDNSNEELDERVSSLVVDDEDLYSLSQRFPTTIGISCCLDKNETPLLPSDLTIHVSGRYYTKISKHECCNIVVRFNDNGFIAFYNNYKEKLDLYFTLVDDGIHLSHDISQVIGDVKETILTINKELCRKVATDSQGVLDSEYDGIRPNYRYLKSYKERLWGKLKFFKEQYLSLEKQNLINTRIDNIEKYETYLSYLEDAMNICNSKSFGFWRSHTFDKVVDLSFIDFNQEAKKLIFSPKKNEKLNILFNEDQKESSFLLRLSIWLQVTKWFAGSHSKHYLKVQLENTSTPFEENNEHYFSIVTEKVNERCFFGVQIRIESPLLAPYQEHTSDSLQEDVNQLNYLYRSIKDYGVGHLCSVDWMVNEKEKWVKSEFIPSYETPDIEPTPRNKFIYVEENGKLIPKPFIVDLKVLEFKWLSLFSNVTDDEIIDNLKKFVQSYGDWIKTQREEVIARESGDNRVGEDNLTKCQADCDRMLNNIQLLLENNSDNMLTFRLMNTAMFIQLWHSKRFTNEKTTFEFYKDKADDHLFGNFPVAWRPFQLAFILLNIDGIIQRPDDTEWKYRNKIVDLVWFPTGGGKTEAYLGIIAFTIINRRRTEPVMGGGTTAIMRYTLRLLATQQFQRAMRLILALEQLRRWKIYGLGDEPISIGLFVGDNSLPNKANGKNGLLEECQKWNMFENGKRKGSRIPLDKCPCCGQPLKYQNIGSSQSEPKIVFRCDNINCTFSDSIPVMLCDEYIYQNPPTLLFGTVDKFAALGHRVSATNERQDSRRLFGKGTLGFLPPSLIIQDELHLLLGPLGSAVSLFECAIDQLCSYKDKSELIVRPKIISSTATTRNTELQIRALYDRDVSIFPKPGIDYDDSFFAFYRREMIDNEVRYISKRKYIGIFPTGRTHMTTQMRLVATMFIHRALFEQEHSSELNDGKVQRTMDFYHSIIDYFNSLKEVGKTDAQFFTEFTKYTRRLFKRVLRYTNKLECLYAYDSSFKKSELTGRLTGAEIVDELKEVEKHWTSEGRYPHKDSETNQWVQGNTPPDLILATNMISVGLDVDRFNTIIMNSMPRNIAEYIQASSRVARNEQGLVVTLHNPFRARDVSHFERFKEFHEKLYYYVEPISITPFSKKSIDKYLPLYLATMIRHSYPNLANQESASILSLPIRKELFTDLSVYFKNRLSWTKDLPNNLSELLTPELEKYIEQFIASALENWQQLVDKQKKESYSLRYSGATIINGLGKSPIKWKDLFLALDAYMDEETENMWLVPMSLRTVEAEAVLNIKEN